MNKQNSNNVLLAIETATFEVGAALVIDGEVVGELSQPAENRHAEELFVLIEQLLITAGIRLGDVGAFAVDIGPGLFTGLRVGVAAANALAYALSRPVIGISGTSVLGEALLRNLPDHNSGTLAVPVLDVRRGEVAFELNGQFLSGPRHAVLDSATSGGVTEGTLSFGSPKYFCQTLVSFIDQITGNKTTDSVLLGASKALCLLIAGSGAYRYRETLESDLRDLLGEYENVTFSFAKGFATPPISVLGALAYDLFQKGGLSSEGSLQKPLYLREADAKVGAWKNAKIGK